MTSSKTLIKINVSREMAAKIQRGLSLAKNSQESDKYTECIYLYDPKHKNRKFKAGAEKEVQTKDSIWCECTLKEYQLTGHLSSWSSFLIHQHYWISTRDKKWVLVWWFWQKYFRPVREISHLKYVSTAPKTILCKPSPSRWWSPISQDTDSALE